MLVSRVLAGRIHTSNRGIERTEYEPKYRCMLHNRSSSCLLGWFPLSIRFGAVEFRFCAPVKICPDIAVRGTKPAIRYSGGPVEYIPCIQFRERPSGSSHGAR